MTLNSSESELLFPATSMVFARKTCNPSPRNDCPCVDTNRLQFPFASVWAVPNRLSPRYNSTWLPASELPTNFSALVFETWFVADPCSGSTPRMAGAAGSCLSTTTFSFVDSPLVFPARSVEIAENIYSPMARALETVYFHLPFAVASTVATNNPSRSTRTCEPASA